MTVAKPKPTGAVRRPEPLYDWIGIIDRCTWSGLGMAPKTIRAISTRFGLHADPNGSNCRPGVARVAMLTGYDYKTVKDVIAILDSLGLIAKVSSGSGRPAPGKFSANCYQLTIPEDLIERLDVLSPAEFELGVERIRAANRRKPNTGGQTPRIGCGKQVTGEANTGGTPTRIEVQVGSDGDGITGNPSPRNSEIRGTPALKYGGADAAVLTSDLPPTDTYPAINDLDTAVTGTRARGCGQEDFDQNVADSTAPPTATIGPQPTRGPIPGQSQPPAEREYTDAEKIANAIRVGYCPDCYLDGKYALAAKPATTCGYHAKVGAI